MPTRRTRYRELVAQERQRRRALEQNQGALQEALQPLLWQLEGREWASNDRAQHAADEAAQRYEEAVAQIEQRSQQAVASLATQVAGWVADMRWAALPWDDPAWADFTPAIVGCPRDLARLGMLRLRADPARALPLLLPWGSAGGVTLAPASQAPAAAMTALRALLLRLLLLAPLGEVQLGAEGLADEIVTLARDFDLAVHPLGADASEAMTGEPARGPAPQRLIIAWEEELSATPTHPGALCLRAPSAAETPSPTFALTLAQQEDGSWGVDGLQAEWEVVLDEEPGPALYRTLVDAYRRARSTVARRATLLEQAAAWPGAPQRLRAAREVSIDLGLGERDELVPLSLWHGQFAVTCVLGPAPWRAAVLMPLLVRLLCHYPSSELFCGYVGPSPAPEWMGQAASAQLAALTWPDSWASGDWEGRVKGLMDRAPKARVRALVVDCPSGQDGGASPLRDLLTDAARWTSLGVHALVVGASCWSEIEPLAVPLQPWIENWVCCGADPEGWARPPLGTPTLPDLPPRFAWLARRGSGEAWHAAWAEWIPLEPQRRSQLARLAGLWDATR